MSGSIKHYRNKLEQLKGKQKTILDSIDDKKYKIKKEKRDLENTEQALLIVQEVGKKTQEQLEYHISELVSLALSAIWEEPYEFKVDFVIKRNKTEAEVYFIREGKRINPMLASGGGAVDVAAFALRIALWSLQRPKSHNTIVLDEPFRFLSRELQPKAGKMLQTLSEKLGIQFLIVTHNEDLIDVADKVFENKIKKGMSYVS
jgi:DNA repair exonuclease SbcCD ATPase subunit